MYSTETIGWSYFPFTVSNDVKIDVKTNFGYGWSSYFFINLTYKGIDIHPYSYWVKYYNADKESLMRYTRNYHADRNSWDSAFEFVEEVTNEVTKGESSFVRNFILNEVEELMRGLRCIMNTPMDYLIQCYENRFHKSETNIIGIWHSSNDFDAGYDIYRSELATAVMAEKITGSIDFLSNLSKFEDILPQVSGAIEEIKRMSVAILPKILETITKIQVEIQVRTSKLNIKESEYDAIKSQLEPHQVMIDKLYEEEKEIQLAKSEMSRGNVLRSTVESKYKELHSDYVELCLKQNKLSTEIYNIKSDIQKRASFQNRLEKCVDIVNSNRSSW